MSLALGLLLTALFAVVVAMRITSLTGQSGAVHRQTRTTRQAVAYRNWLDRELHAKSGSGIRHA